MEIDEQVSQLRWHQKLSLQPRNLGTLLFTSIRVTVGPPYILSATIVRVDGTGLDETNRLHRLNDSGDDSPPGGIVGKTLRVLGKGNPRCKSN